MHLYYNQMKGFGQGIGAQIKQNTKVSRTDKMIKYDKQICIQRHLSVFWISKTLFGEHYPVMLRYLG